MRPFDGSSRTTLWLAIGIIAAIGGVAYANSLACEFVFDDREAIQDNPSIRSLTSTAVLFPPRDTTAGGRPLLNLTLAMNYALGGYDVRSYHIVNIVIHLATAVMLFALVRGTLLLPAIPPAFRRSATGIGLAATAIWVVHPLTTEVTCYVVQRCESLAAFFLLAVLFCLLRGDWWRERAVRLHAPAARRPSLVRRYQEAAQQASGYHLLAVVSAFLGVMCKETMAVAPVVVLLYDRAFLAGSFREAIRRRRWTYIGLLGSWVLLAILIVADGGRGGTVGFGSAVSPWRYAAAQSAWVLHYFRLSVWPEPLVFDYGYELAPWDANTQTSLAVVLILLGVAIGIAAFRPAIGFLLLTPFILLAPSSSFIPVVSQVAAERRMYLALGSVVILFVLMAAWTLNRLPFSTVVKRGLAMVLIGACVVILGRLTWLRNEDYRTNLALWKDTASKVPGNARAQSNYGRALLDAGRYEEAIPPLQEAVRLAPDHALTRSTLGVALLRLGQAQEAIECFRYIVEQEPKEAGPKINLAAAYQAAGRYDEAIKWYQRALAEDPNKAETHFGLGICLSAAGKQQEAFASFEAAARLNPRFAARPSVGR